MVSKGVRGDCATISGASMREGKLEEAEGWFREAKNKGIELDARAYSIVIEAVCKKPDLHCGMWVVEGDEGYRFPRVEGLIWRCLRGRVGVW
ncbi:hypothetical protein OIU78_026515 [Salix suchowensis]|nr:hypothetical protein OIU78_026515 [Salix suchowensis]